MNYNPLFNSQIKEVPILSIDYHKLIMIRVLTVFCLSFIFSFGYSQNHPLKSSIEELINSYDGTLGVSIYDPQSGDQIRINGDSHLPMQSVYKFHLALTVLRDVDAGRCSLTDSITITAEHIRD